MQQAGHWIWALIAAGVIGAGSAAADCASDEEVARFVADYMDHRPTEALGQGGTMVDALCTQARLSDALAAHLGPVIGYKAGLTSTPAQERFGASAPVRGVLYRDMMLETGATLEVPWGAVPMVEADLVLEIGDSAVNSATTREEVMQNIASIRPFIELPDLAVDQSQPMTPETITAMGVGARRGVLGAAITVEDAAAMTKALAEMQVQLRDGAGEVVLLSSLEGFAGDGCAKRAGGCLGKAAAKPANRSAYAVKNDNIGHFRTSCFHLAILCRKAEVLSCVTLRQTRLGSVGGRVIRFKTV